MKRIQPKASAFTLVEVLVMVCLIVVLFLTIPNAAIGAKNRNLRIACVNNLKNIGLAHRVFATDNGDKFPSELTGAETNSIVAFLRSMTNEMTSPKIFHCPADKGRSPAVSWANLSTNNISYFINIAASETYPQSFLAGDSDLFVNGRPLESGRNVVPISANVSWSNRHMGSSAIVMGDGSVQQLSLPRLNEALANSGTNDMILLAP